MRDVAEAAGVSQATVSLVLNDVQGSGISEATKVRVREEATALGYRHNAMARGLKLRRSDTIGFLSDHIMASPYACGLVTGAQDAAREAGKQLLILNLDLGPSSIDRQAADSAVEEFLERRVDGIVYATMFHRIVEPPAGLFDVRSVLLDARAHDASIPSVVPDDYEAALHATRFLVNAGHHRIGFLTRILGPPASELRLAGYQAALSADDLPMDPTLIVEGADTTPGGYESAMALLARNDRPTAVFCFNDQMAMGVYQAAATLGLRIPTDLSIIGFDDVDLIAPVLKPGLTTMRLPHHEMGRWAVETLLDPTKHGSIDQYKMNCPLVVRDSVASISRS